VKLSKVQGLRSFWFERRSQSGGGESCRDASTVSANLEDPAYKNPRLALWSEIKNGLGWRGLVSAKN
jgi:hypothetical protein